MPANVTPRRVVMGLGAVVVVGLAAFAALQLRPVSVHAPLASATVDLVRPDHVATAEQRPRTVDAYKGLGAWIDGFDYSPPYSSTGVPPLAPSEVSAMAAAGVTTLYLQSGRLDDRSPDLLEDRWLLAEFLMRASQHDIDVVAWYLPKWGDDSTDLDHLMAAHNFEVLGLRFDGIAVDIEWNQDGLEVEERNERFVRLSRLLSIQTGADPLGAIVLPPVQTEVINPSFWPDFPWEEIDHIYDVWLPMSYWSFRTDPYDDGYEYNEESVRRLRTNLGQPDALVHPIGGIGAQIDAPPSGVEPYIARVDQLQAFAQSLADTRSIGGSIYDWLTTDADGRATLAELFATGPAASLGEG